MFHGSDAAAGSDSERMLLSTRAFKPFGSLPPEPAMISSFMPVAASPVTKQVEACLGSSFPSSGSPEPRSALNCFQLLPSREYQASEWLAPYLTKTPVVLFQSVGA